MDLQIYLAVTPGEYQEAAKYNRAFAHVAYRIGPGSTLLRQNLLLQTKGGLLSISDREAPEISDAQALCAAVLRECGRRGYTGALLDFERPAREDRVLFAQQLGRLLSTSRRTLYVPESYAHAVTTSMPYPAAALQSACGMPPLCGAVRQSLRWTCSACEWISACPPGQARGLPFLPRSSTG